MTEATKGREGALLRNSRPYPQYRDSGIHWLGEIPSHWEVKRLGLTVTACQNGVWGSEADGIDDTVCVRVADFDRLQFRVNLEEPTVRSIEPDLAKARRLREGDLLLEKSGGGEKQPVGAVVVYDHQEPAVCSNFVARMPVSDRCHPRYLTYLHAALYAARVNTRSIKQSTGIQNLDSESYLNERAGLPNGSEQRAIADFLDRETTKIDSLVAKKERLIDLLQEKRTALVTGTVTRGLDPDVPMKDSGVEWVGSVPGHWSVKRIKRLCLVQRGASPRPIDDPAYFDDEGEYSWVRIADVTRSDVYLERTTQRLSELGRSKSVTLEPGDLFLSIAATVGKPIVTKIKCCIHDGFVYFVGLEENRKFMFYLFSCGEAYKGLGKLGTQLNLNTDTVGGISVPVPRRDEQDAIVRFLDHETARIDKLIAKVHEAVEHLNELRTALISAAVTGKIAVREATSR